MRPRSYRRKRTTSPSRASATVTAPSPSDSSPAHLPCPSRALARRLDPRDTERPLGVLGDEDTTAADVVERVGPLVGPRLAFAERLRHLLLELGPELAEHGLVGLGRAADRHGTSDPVSR